MSKAQLAGNYAASGGSGDPEYVAEQLAAMRSEQSSRSEISLEHESTKQRLEAKRKEAAERTVKVLGEPVKFERPGAKRVQEAIDLRQQALSGNGDADAESDLFDYVFDLLADHSIDPDMDAEWWGTFSTGTLMQVFEDVAIGGVDAETREAVEKFRNE